MKQKINLQEIERKAWRSYFQDGLIDMFIGIIMVTSAIRTFTDNVWFTFLIFVGVFIMIGGKRYITNPRVGVVKFGPERTMKRLKLGSLIGIAVIITVILVLPVPFIRDFMKALPQIIPSLMVASLFVVIFGAMAYYLNYSLLAVYGLMFAAGELLWEIYGIPVGPSVMLIFGCMILGIGIFCLSQFLRKYPLPVGEAVSGS